MIPLMYISGNTTTNRIYSTQLPPPNNISSTCVPCAGLNETLISDNYVINIGDYWPEEGGYYAGLFSLTGKDIHALILSRKSDGHISGVGFSTNRSIAKTINITRVMQSTIDGKINTENALQYAAQNNNITEYPFLLSLKNKNLNILNGFNDWYIPAEQELLLIFRTFKPNNDCIKNNSSVCTGQVVNGNNLLCNLCNTDTVTQTSNNLFLYGGTENIDHSLGIQSATPYALYNSTAPSGTTLDTNGYAGMGIMSLAYSNMYRYVMGYGWIDGWGVYNSAVRLVRRVKIF